VGAPVRWSRQTEHDAGRRLGIRVDDVRAHGAPGRLVRRWQAGYELGGFGKADRRILRRRLLADVSPLFKGLDREVERPFLTGPELAVGNVAIEDEAVGTRHPGNAAQAAYARADRAARTGWMGRSFDRSDMQPQDLA